MDVQDIEKWRARESTLINFTVFYWYKIVAGMFHYRVRPCGHRLSCGVTYFFFKRTGSTIFNPRFEGIVLSRTSNVYDAARAALSTAHGCESMRQCPLANM